MAAGARSNGSFTEWLAPQNLIDCLPPNAYPQAPVATKGCLGGWHVTALGYINQTGIATEASYTYTAVNGATCALDGASMQYPLSSLYVVAPKDTASIQAAVAMYGAVVAVIHALPDFVIYQGGVYNNPACTAGVLSHGVTIVGYGTDPASGLDYWLVKNSFGIGWGEGGYFRMARGVNMCGIEDNVAVPVPRT